MRRFKSISCFGILLLFVFGLAACLDMSSSDSGDKNSSETEEAPETLENPTLSEGEEIVEIGYSGPLSGPAAQYGINVMNGLEMAAEEINEMALKWMERRINLKSLHLMINIYQMRQA